MISRPTLRSALLAAALLIPGAALAQTTDPLTAPYPDCDACVGWNEPQRPLHIFGNTYWVGTRGLGAILIASPDGHILIDGALPNSAPLILANIRTLGFDPGDVALILNSHAHYDHAGGLAALRAATGARVAASARSAPVIESGRVGPGDPQFGIAYPMPPVDRVETFAHGDTLRVGAIAVAALLTPGHTEGGTSWSWRTCEGERCLELVYADSQTPVSADGFRYTDRPDLLAGYDEGLARLEAARCDLIVTPHPGASRFFERHAEGLVALVEPDGCRRYAAAAKAALAARLEREAAAK